MVTEPKSNLHPVNKISFLTHLIYPKMEIITLGLNK